MRIMDAIESMKYAAHMQKKYYDRKHAPLPLYKIGDFVSLHLDKHPLSVIKHNKLSQQKLLQLLDLASSLIHTSLHKSFHFLHTKTK